MNGQSGRAHFIGKSLSSCDVVAGADDIEATIGCAGGIEAVVAAMHHHCGNAGLQESACRALSILGHNREAKAHLIPWQT
jgi:hypothetical protein